uniref:Uncharacterized protein n=1 Tax=Medicago truncatula TaxID=3880 RepID=I3S240_MEDTR|nr:unknown [Medicago truncatula]
MSQQFHLGIFKPRYITHRTIFLSTSIGLVGHRPWTPFIFTLVYFCIRIAKLNCNVTFQLIFKSNSLNT